MKGKIDGGHLTKEFHRLSSNLGRSIWRINIQMFLLCTKVIGTYRIIFA